MVTTYRTIKIKIMYSLIILLSRGKMSDYADFNSSGSVALHIIVILVIVGFFLYAYIKINWTNIKIIRIWQQIIAD